MKKGMLVTLMAALIVGLSGIAFAGPTSIVQPLSQAGFPIKISKPGSYILNSNLVVTSPNTTAISVSSSNVSIDLNGFSIIGPAICTGCPASCSSTGSGNGIYVVTGGNVRIANGVITGMGNDGIFAFDNTVVDNVRAIGNGCDGIAFPLDFRITNSVANYNGCNGINTLTAGLVQSNVANCNTEYGLFLAIDVAYTENSAVNNGVANCSSGVDLGHNYCP